MNEDQVLHLLKENNLEWKGFNDWIFGQTVQLCEKTNQILYYPWDVKRYINMKVDGTPTYFD